jgi:hypothetical protein
VALPAHAAGGGFEVDLNESSNERKRTMMNELKLAGAVLFLGALVLSGCGGSTVEAPTKSAPSAAELPPGFILTEAPSGAKSVSELKQTAKDGDEVVVRGQVGGKDKGVFTPGYASFYLADLKLKACNLKPDDDCKTPWDFCCEERSTILSNLISIEARDAGGKPLKTDLKGVDGIDLLSVLIVRGKAVRQGSDENLTIVPTGIYVEKVGKY